jgi:outer membrane autotransporter protein
MNTKSFSTEASRLRSLTAVAGAVMAAMIPFSLNAQVVDENGKVKFTEEIGVYTATLTEANNTLIGMQSSGTRHEIIQGSTGTESVTFKGDSNQQFSMGSYGEYEIKNLGNVTLSGKWAADGSVFYTNTSGSFTVDVGSIQTAEDIDDGTIVFHAMGGSFDIKADSIHLDGVGNGVFAQTNSSSTASTVNIDVTGDVFIRSTGVAVGAANLSESNTSPSSSISINATNITLENTSASGSAVAAYGQHWETNADLSNSNKVTLTANESITLTGANAINANNGASATADDMATVTVASKYVDINGNIVANTNAAVSIGENETFDRADIAGDIVSTGNVDVHVNLGNNGTFTGGVTQTPAGSGEAANVPGVVLDLGNNSTWEVTKQSTVDTVQGTGNLVLQDRTNTVQIDQLGDGSTVNATVANATADDFSNPSEEVPALVQVGTVGEGASLTTSIAEGDINGAITLTTTDQGTNQTQDSNTKLESFRSVNVLGLMQWRHEMNDLTKRMGELRDSPEGVGTWVRAYGSELEHGSQNVKTRNTSIQVGADYDVGYGWKVGAAFSYTDTDASMDNGSASGDMFGFAIYGSWLHESGQFVDLIAKYTRMDNDFDIGNMSGSYDNNGYSISAEYGWNLRFNELAFVEPQLELTYGTVTGDDLTASNDVKIEQDDVDSFIGRIGVRGGFLFPNNKGTVYARASVLHDFDGDTGFKASKGNNHAYFTDDLGGTWYEFGVGANFNWTENTYTYVDLERTTSGEVNENWRWNVGLRHVF